MLTIAFFSGIVIIGLSIATSMILNLEPLHFAVLVLIYLFVSGKIIGLLGAKFIRFSPLPPLMGQSDEEIEAIVRKRGLEKTQGKRKN